MVEPTPDRFRDLDVRLDQIERELYPETSSGKRTEEICRPLLEALIAIGQSPLVRLWSVNPQDAQLILIDHVTTDEELNSSQPRVVLDSHTTKSGKSVASRHCEFISDLLSTTDNRKFNDHELRQRLGLHSFLAIPITNIGNPHQVLFVITWFFGKDFLPTESDVNWLKVRLTFHAKSLADAIESNLRERSLRAFLTVSQRIGKLEVLTKESAYKELSDILRGEILPRSQYANVTLFTEDWTGTTLSPRTALTEPHAEDSVPTHVVDAWQRNREKLITVRDKVPDGLFSGTEIPEHVRSVMLVPLHNPRGKCRGVIRCVKCSPTPESSGHLSSSLFTYDDIAIVEAMEQSFGPFLEMLLAAEQREISLHKLSHELRVPITAFNAILERMRRECETEHFRFRFNHFKEATHYANLMNRLTKELDFVRKGPSAAPMILQETRLLSDVIAPAVRFIEPVLRKHKFKPFQVSYSGFDSLLTVSADAGFLTQVLFNLLENAVKYYPQGRPAGDFRCLIVGRDLGTMVEVRVTDNGDPIPQEERKRLFTFGFRGSRGTKVNVEGNGLGLWISRAVIERHAGELFLDNDLTTTTFVIHLPLYRSSFPSLSNIPRA